MGKYEQAIVKAEKSLTMNPDDLRPQYVLTAAYSAAGLMDEANAAASVILTMAPKLTLEKYSKTLQFKNPADKELLISNLRKAGLPD